MKTIEEKARAYDEALERAKRMFSEQELNYLFPNSKNREDKRIRNELIKHLRDGAEGYIPAGSSEDYARWLTWLEKQDTNKEYVFRPIAGTMIENAVEQAQKQGNVVLAFNGFYTPVKGKTSDEILSEYYSWIKKQDKQQPIDNKEKLELLKFIRKETCCGLVEANNALLKLIEVLKEHPLPIMDKPRKLKIEWDVGKKELKKSDDEKKSVNEVTKIRQELYQSGYNDGYKHGQEDIAMSLKKESIEALEHFVRSIGESGYTSPYDNRTKLVYALLEQLKQIVK